MKKVINRRTLMGDFLRKWHEAIVPGGTNEVWWLEAEN